MTLAGCFGCRQLSSGFRHLHPIWRHRETGPSATRCRPTPYHTHRCHPTCMTSAARCLLQSRYRACTAICRGIGLEASRAACHAIETWLRAQVHRQHQAPAHRRRQPPGGPLLRQLLVGDHPPRPEVHQEVPRLRLQEVRRLPQAEAQAPLRQHPQLVKRPIFRPQSGMQFL